MVQKIIEQMTAELNDTRFCKSDFEYDLKSLNGYDGPFFWMVRQNGTSLQLIGASEMLKWKECQGMRFQMFRDKNWAIASIMYWNEPNTKYFYYDGISMVSVTKEDIPVIWDALFSSFLNMVIEEHQDEYNIKDEPLDIEYASEETEKRMKEAMKLAEGMQDTSLQACLDNLSKHWRSSDNHVIQIYNDFAKHSFGWSEIINGKCVMNGGLIYHDYKKNDHWQIHS